MTTTVVRPERARRRRRATRDSVWESRALVGSTRTRVGASVRRARARATRWRWPPESDRPFSVIMPARPASREDRTSPASATSRAARRRSSPSAWAGAWWTCWSAAATPTREASARTRSRRLEGRAPRGRRASRASRRVPVKSSAVAPDTTTEARTCARGMSVRGRPASVTRPWPSSKRPRRVARAAEASGSAHTTAVMAPGARTSPEVSSTIVPVRGSAQVASRSSRSAALPAAGATARTRASLRSPTRARASSWTVSENTHRGQDR